MRRAARVRMFDRPADRQGSVWLVLLLALHVGVLLNAVTWWRRYRGEFAGLPGIWGPIAGGSEVLLIGGLSLLLLTLAALLGRVVWRLASTTGLLASALCAYYMSTFNVLIGYGVMQAVFTTDHDMSGEVVGTGMLLWTLLLGVLPAWWLWRQPAPPSLRRLWRTGSGQRRAVLMLLLVALGLLALGHAGLKRAAPHARQADGDALINLSGIAAHSYVPSNWIAGSLMVASNQWSARAATGQLAAPAARFAYQGSTALDDVTLVVVIGESARHDRMGQFGHHRDTTPLMGALPGVAGFKARSCDTSTKLSISCMFVRPEGIVWGDGLSVADRITEETVFSVFKSLGFRITLHALQSEVGLYQRMRPDSYSMREMIFADPRHARSARNDLLLVDALRADLQQHPGGRQVRILHLKGSHYLYTQRYPREFARWQPECPGVDAGCSKAQLLNSYDNSILFTDHVLAQMVHTLRGRKALLVYTSDHGESIDDNSHFHATPRKLAPPEQRRVPLLFWASDALRADLALAPGLARLRERAGADEDGRTHHGMLFASLLGCLGITSANGGITSADNLCHAAD